jgi:hypothetical protein
MEIKNLTPHDVVVHVLGGVRIIPPTGIVARVRTRRFLRDSIDISGLRIPCAEMCSEGIENLPGPEDGSLFIVSAFVGQHPMVRGREDVVVPDTRYAARDKYGNVQAVSAFVRYS